MEAAGERVDLSVAVASIFGGEIDFNIDVRPGDRFELVVEKEYRRGADPRERGEFAGYGPILAAEFNTAGRTLRAVRFTPQSGVAGYYDELRSAFGEAGGQAHENTRFLPPSFALYSATSASWINFSEETSVPRASATPTEIGRPSSARTRRRIALAISAGGPKRWVQPATSASQGLPLHADCTCAICRPAYCLTAVPEF